MNTSPLYTICSIVCQDTEDFDVLLTKCVSESSINFEEDDLNSQCNDTFNLMHKDSRKLFTVTQSYLY